MFFEKNVSVSKILGKDLMSNFIRAGIFPADYKNGLPIRKILRELDEANQLSLFPMCYRSGNRQTPTGTSSGITKNWFQ
jgi:hypothetical protein